MTEKIIEIRTRMAENVRYLDYSDYERRLQYIELRGRLLELRYNHNHDDRGRFCSGGGGGRMSSSSAVNSASLDKSRKSDIKEKVVSGALDPESKEAEKHTEQYYESVRKMKTDVKRISNNTGFNEEDIKQIKNHVFIKKHDLGGVELEYFYPSYEMAQSWQRLIDGKNIQRHDITLLNHEKMESNLMRQGYSQEKAHRTTEQKYNYAKESKEYHAKVNKHNKK